jgi:hypothetical protein
MATVRCDKDEEKTYTEFTESAEFTEKKNPRARHGGVFSCKFSVVSFRGEGLKN